MDFDKYSEGNQLLHDIVHYDRIPTRIQRFWNSLALSGDSPKRWNVISVLNTMLKQEIPEGIDMISWYEIFRDIFLVRAREEESRTRAAKTPRFTTFDRTFEQLAFLPEYWLDCSGDDNGNREKKRPLPDPARLLFSFERYLYNQDGGACWSAIDWGMPKYCFRVVCENRKHPQFNVAALLLTAHCIANGKMGLYVGEKTGVNLPYAGISGEGDTRNPLLKYFHFDRFTRLSFIRKNELVLDADSMSRTPMFEPQWQTPAMMAEFILQENSARATKTTCSRVSTSSFIRALNVLKGVNALGGIPIDGNRKAVVVLSRIEKVVGECKSLTKDEKDRLLKNVNREIEDLNAPDEDAKTPLMQCLDNAIALLDSPGFARIDPQKMLNMIGVRNAKFIPADFHLRQQGIDSAKDFWDRAEAAYEPIRDVYRSTYSRIVKRFTKEQYARQSEEHLPDRDSEFLKRVLRNGQLDELRGRMDGRRLRSALKTLLVEEQFELNCGQMLRILDLDFNDENLSLYFPVENLDCILPCRWLTSDVKPEKAAPTLRVFCLELLSDFSRSRKTGTIIRDFVNRIDRETVQNESDRLWNIYFSRENEDVCFARWMLSLEDSIGILAGPDRKYNARALPRDKARARLLEDNRKEFRDLASKKQYDRKKALEKIRAFDGYSLEDVLPSVLRNLVILDLLAHLMVETALVPPFDEIWSDERTLKAFFTHLLYAAPKEVDAPLPFHIGIYSDTLRRKSRSTDDQRDNINRLLKHHFDNAGERYLFQLMLLNYLKRTDHPQDRLKAIIDNAAMSRFVSADRLIRLKNYL